MYRNGIFHLPSNSLGMFVAATNALESLSSEYKTTLEIYPTMGGLFQQQKSPHSVLHLQLGYQEFQTDDFVSLLF